MNREDIIRMAREVGIDPESDTLCNYDGWVDTLVDFAVLVAAAEREACARECDIQASWGNVDERFGARQCSHAIRSRRQKMT